MYANQVTRSTQNTFVDWDEELLPDPPDNYDDWNGLLTEAEREEYSRRFEAGMAHEYTLIRARIQAEYALARARQEEDVKRAAERQARRQYAGRRGR